MTEKPSISVERKGAQTTPSPAKTIASFISGIIKFIYTAIIELVGLVFWGINIIIIFLILFFKTISSVLHIIIVYVPRIIGRFVPPSISMKLDQVLVYAGIGLSAEEVIGMTVVYSVVVSLVVFLLSNFLGLTIMYKITASAIAFITVWVFPNVMLDALLYRRTQSVEAVLPDVLDIIAQNIRAGMTTDRALWSAARPEFGPLAVELQTAARATLTGTPLPDALIGITNRVKSDRLEQAIRLIIQGVTSGGELPAILQTVAIDMRSEHNLLKQMKSETNSHVMFILFAILFGAPLLFAVSLQFIMVFSTLFSKIDITQLSSLPEGTTAVMIHPFLITPHFYQIYAYVTLSILAFFGSFLVGLLRTGRPIAGLQSVPGMILITLVMFMVLNYILSNVFSGVFASGI
ncbi:MAG: type II secretion system F family protein [Candidatus Altiarchaeota archaeon]|nr:type II secretion system F family protein [Candidatus Altiarchaeota archaeon]